MFTPVTSAQAAILAINSLAGTDTVSLNNPNTPTGLTGITVTGGDPTSFDTLIVNGVAATLGINVGTRTIAGATHEGLIGDKTYAAATSQAILDVVTAVRSQSPLPR